MDEAIEITTETPPSTTDIMTAIHDVHEDVRGLKARLEQVEQIIETLPTVYASAGDLNKVKTSQAGYETGLRQLTEQVGGLTIITADNQKKFGTIETRLNDLTGVMNTMTGNLQTFMDNQRDRLDNQQTIVTEVKDTTAELKKDVTFVKTDLEDTKTRLNVQFTPLQDYVLGSPTQEGLKTTFNRVFTEVHELRSSVSQQSAEYGIVASYVNEQKAKEAAHVSFRQRIYLQMFTKTGFALVVGAVFLLIVLAQSIDLERSFVWIRNAAALFGVKVG